jgi:hypothetical protein
VTVIACGGGSSSSNSTSPNGGPNGDDQGSSDDGGNGTTGTGTAVSADQAASDAANAYCNRAEACAPAFVTVGFGNVATCIERLKQSLLPVFGADGTSSTPERTEACAQAIPQMSCSDLLSRITPDACQTLPGSLAEGAACSADSQCQGTRCKVAADAVCGKCTSPAAAGAACNQDADCQDAMTCVSGACMTYAATGGTCDATHPCRPDLACKAGKCATPTPVGQSCKSSDECENSQGVFCDPKANTCQAVSFSAPNGTCGLVQNALVVCEGPGSLCTNVNSQTYQGTCAPVAADGAACDPANGPLCNAGAICVNKVCTVPNPGACH